MPPLSRDKQRVAELLEDKHRQFHQAILARPPQAQAAALALIEDATAAGCKICILTDLPAPATPRCWSAGSAPMSIACSASLPAA
jgi:hypothetical protein